MGFKGVEFLFFKDGKTSCKRANVDNTIKSFYINILHFMIHSRLYTNVMFTSTKGKEPQRIQATKCQLHSTELILFVVSILHFLDPEGNGKCRPTCGLTF